MKLSEAIRAGACLTKPWQGSLLFGCKGDTFSCALGAAFIGVAGLSTASAERNIDYESLANELGLTADELNAIYTANDGRFGLQPHLGEGCKPSFRLDNRRPIEDEAVDIRLVIAEDLERMGL